MTSPVRATRSSRPGAIARSLGDAERLARAAIGNYRGHVFASPGWHEPAIDLLEEALTVLPDEDDPLRARVLAALGLEVYFMSDQERANDVERGRSRHGPPAR